MPRPGFVLEIDESTPAILSIGGTQLQLQNYGLGTNVLYGADPEPSSDPIGLLTAAVEAPLESESLADRLAACKSLTIVFGDATTPKFPMKFDVRRDIIEHVLELAARAGIDDVALLAATGLNESLTEPVLVSILGDRVVRSFAPMGLITSHDVTASGQVTIGEVSTQPVRVNERLVNSDLVINVVVRDSDSPVPHHQLVSGVCDVDTIDYVYGLAGLDDPARGEAVAALLVETLPIFTIEAILGQPIYDRPLRFIGHREWEWNLADQLSWVAVRQIISTAPKQAANRLFSSLRADYPVLDIIAGQPDVAETQSREVWRAANQVAIAAPADVLVASVWGTGDWADPVGSPIAAAHDALAVQAAAIGGGVREGGVLLAHHPLPNRFNRHNSAAVDFFADVLSATIDPGEIRQHYQDRFTSDSWYLELYRAKDAYHPLQVFHQWYALTKAQRNFADVIWVGGDRKSAAVLGHRAATTYGDAMEMARQHVGESPRILVKR